MNAPSVDNAPDVDGYKGNFFQGCWPIIQEDILRMVQRYFLGDYLHKHMQLTSLTLIPKIKKPRTLADYRPISLSNFSSKVVSKILANKLARILP